MTALLALAAAQAAVVVVPAVQAPVVQPTVAPVPMPPADWTTLADVPYLRPSAMSADLSHFVRDEVRAGRCTVSARTLRVDLAVFVAASGRARRIVPRAIDCPTVEQYASGLVSRMARGNLAAPGADTWYRTSLTFAWSE